MTAWVLIFGLGYTRSFTVSGIASEQACVDLSNKLRQEWYVDIKKFKCYSYELAR